jgi:hypothetical protein
MFSCQDDNLLENLDQNNLQACHDYALIEKTIVDIEREIEHAFISTQTTKNLPNYISLNNDTSNQDTLIINFGEDNFLHLGHIKRGEIIIIYNKFLYDNGANISTTFTDFYINNNLVQGNIVLSNIGFNENENLEFNLEINNLSLNTENGIINLSGNYNKEMVEGFSTQYQYLDNVYHVSGNASGNSVNNNSFNINISDSIIYNLSCFQTSSCIITKGLTQVNPSIYDQRILDYGNGNCDCEISAIIEEENYPLIIN